MRVLIVVLIVLAGCSAPATPPAPADVPEQAELEPQPEAYRNPKPDPEPEPDPDPEPHPEPAPTPNATQPEERNWTSDPWTLEGDGWAEPGEARIYPGVQVLSWRGGCTVNFVFTDPAGTTVYVGTAAHCASPPEGEFGDHPCDELHARPEPEERLAFFGPHLRYEETGWGSGRYVYNSNWLMHEIERDTEACRYNDFALIEIDPEFRHLVNPTVEHWAGVAGIEELRPATGEKLYTVGGTIFRTCPEWQREYACPEEVTRAREGWVPPSQAGPLSLPDEWSGYAYLVGGCLPGDSGSPMMDREGHALGVLTSGLHPPGVNICIYVYLTQVLQYMAEHTGQHVVLHNGTQPFRAGLLPGA